MVKNKLTFWDRLKIAKKHKLKIKSVMKDQGINFFKELLVTTSKTKNLNNIERLFGYLHYEVGLTLSQIQNDLGLVERHTRAYNQNLLDKFNIRDKATP